MLTSKNCIHPTKKGETKSQKKDKMGKHKKRMPEDDKNNVAYYKKRRELNRTEIIDWEDKNNVAIHRKKNQDREEAEVETETGETRNEKRTISTPSSSSKSWSQVVEENVRTRGVEKNERKPLQ